MLMFGSSLVRTAEIYEVQGLWRWKMCRQARPRSGSNSDMFGAGEERFKMKDGLEHPKSASPGASLVIEEHAIEMGESSTLQSALESVAEVTRLCNRWMGSDWLNLF